MNQVEILDYITGGINFIAIAGLGVSVAYLSSMLLLSDLHHYPKNQRIKTQEELEKVVKEEAEKLNIDFNKIKVNFYGENMNLFISGGTYAQKKGNFYELHFDGENSVTIRVVRHELYHVFKKDCDRDKKSLIYYLFVAEPRASLYGVFGIKL